MNTTKAIFLDRDGVINQTIVRDGKPYPPATIHELKWVDGIEVGLKLLKDAGFLLFIVTNQPDVARGTTLQSTIDEIHQHMMQVLPLDEIFCCFHDDKDDCICRKPKPGMVLQAAAKWNVDLKKSFFVGDRWRDIEAGKAAGIKTILIDYHYNEKKVAADFTATNFTAVTNFILNTTT